MCIYRHMNELLWRCRFLCIFSLTGKRIHRGRPSIAYPPAAYKWLLHFSNCFFIDKRLWSVGRALPVTIAFISYWILLFVLFFFLWLTPTRVHFSSYSCTRERAFACLLLCLSADCSGVRVCVCVWACLSAMWLFRAFDVCVSERDLEVRFWKRQSISKWAMDAVKRSSRDKKEFEAFITGKANFFCVLFLIALLLSCDNVVVYSLEFYPCLISTGQGRLTKLVRKMCFLKKGLFFPFKANY